MRWRLALSYAAIALLTALALGAVLLISLRGYYAQHEQNYLLGNARAIALTTSDLLEADLPPEAIRAQIDSFAFLSKTRIKLADAQGRVLADSGIPTERYVVFFSSRAGPDAAVADRGVIPSSPVSVTKDMTFIMFDEPFRTLVSPTQGSMPVVRYIGEEVAPMGVAGYASIVPAVGTFYGFGLATEVVDAGGRSRQMARWPISDEAGRLEGTIVLSDGPAYGSAILRSVALGWGIAGSVAVLLAAAVGWLISRHLSEPLLALTTATGRMAEGDLAARANVTRRDEFGALAHSFNQMADQLEKTIVALRRFVADAAHELHTPLTALRTNLELAASDSAGEERLAFVERAQEQVSRLQALANSLLHLSRLEAGSAFQEQAQLDLADLLRQTSEPYASRAEQAGLAFSLDLPDGPVMIQGSAAQMSSAIGNLLDNACKFTPEGGMVRAGLRQKENWVELWVEDSGIGIPQEDLPQLFSRFHRGRNATSYPGSGLGLAIVKTIVESHGGEVWAESPSCGAGGVCPSGTRFFVRLPRLQVRA